MILRACCVSKIKAILQKTDTCAKGWVKNLSEVADEKKMKVNEAIDEDGKINEKLEDDAKGYFLDTKVFGWIIIIYLVIGLYNLLVV